MKFRDDLPRFLTDPSFSDLRSGLDSSGKEKHLGFAKMAEERIVMREQPEKSKEERGDLQDITEEGLMRKKPRLMEVPLVAHGLPNAETLEPVPFQV
jgi:hypothetical protein